MSEREQQEMAENVAKMVTAEMQIYAKEVLTLEEASKFLGLSKSYLYKMTMNNTIPYYKPNGKLCYFNRTELEQWMQSNRIATAEEMADEANKIIMKGGAR